MSDTERADPRAEYEQRHIARGERVAQLVRQDDRFSLARGLVFLLGLVILVLAASTEAVAWGWLLLPALLFPPLVFGHATLIRSLEAARRAVDFYSTGLARLDNRWEGSGVTGERYRDPAHLYADDLDLFGRGSLFQRICTARTRLGEDALATWLKAPSEVETIQQRHAAVEELRDELDLREELAMLDAQVHDDLDQNGLRRWAQEPPRPICPKRRLLAAGLGIAAVCAVLAWAIFGTGPSPLILVLIAEVIFLWTLRGPIQHLAKTVSEAGSGLAILEQVLEVLEQRSFQSTCLQSTVARLQTDGRPPSRQIARLNSLIEWLTNSLQNQFFAPLAFALCLPVHLVHAIEVWRSQVGEHIPEWLDAVGEFEALSSLAGYAFEHPGDPLPELSGTGPEFAAEGIRHPLLPVESCIPNDVHLGGDLQLILVSGSNMSGKSTLLRSIGTNAVLALAGAPVRARRLKISPLTLGTAMRINDSLQDGRSLFYSVLARLKAVVELTDARYPLLFLLDEILQGTNSHDRRVGAEGIIRRLVARGAIGLVTTHDLALTEIVESLEPRAINVHFEDQLVDGKMSFDYQLREGVVQRSNALELMRMMGLDV